MIPFTISSVRRIPGNIWRYSKGSDWGFRSYSEGTLDRHPRVDTTLTYEYRNEHKEHNENPRGLSTISEILKI
jgi:hypothetical protein